jgi:hypothetical protein
MRCDFSHYQPGQHMTPLTAPVSEIARSTPIIKAESIEADRRIAAPSPLRAADARKQCVRGTAPAGHAGRRDGLDVVSQSIATVTSAVIAIIFCG